MKRTETIDRHLPLQREAARALGLLSMGQKLDAVELNADGTAQVTFTDEELQRLATDAVARGAGIALAFDFANLELRTGEEKTTWMDELIHALDSQGPRRADLLATAGDLARAMANGKAFLDVSGPAIDEAVGASIARGGRVTFAHLNSRFGHVDRDAGSAADLVAMAEKELKPYAAAIRAVDKKVTQLLAVQ